MQHQSDNEDMADRSTSPFGPPKTSTFPAPSKRSANLSPVDEEAPMADSMASSTTVYPFTAGKDNEETRIKAKLEEKKLLQAEIEAKKKKLLERTKRKKPIKDNSLNANAAPFAPTSLSSSKATQDSLAERNALRFGQQSKDSSQTREFLPLDIRAKVDKEKLGNKNPVVSTEKDGREDLENAISLVGTCQYMCPDDELIRRERENDIQQLEIPQPGNLHPPNWSLRNTAVKRFRRSAADYKLDVPEWVRPPDVLERVCGYLEEWVMVSNLARKQHFTSMLKLQSMSVSFLLPGS
jgi:hypothetical protein